MDNIKTWKGIPVEESVRMTEDKDDKWRKYVHGVANPRVADGGRTEQNVRGRQAVGHGNAAAAAAAAAGGGAAARRMYVSSGR